MDEDRREMLVRQLREIGGIPADVPLTGLVRVGDNEIRAWFGDESVLARIDCA